MKKLLIIRRILNIVGFVFWIGLNVSVAQSWTATQGPYGGNIARMKRAPNGNIFAVVNQKLYRSTNNGDTWAEVIPTSPTSIFLNDIIIDVDGKLYAASWSQLFTSADNGATWTTTATNLFQNVQYIERVGPDNVFVIWGNSGVYVSINKGVAWTQINTNSWSGTPGLWANAAGDIFYAIQGGGLLKHVYAGLTANWSSANMTQILTVAPSNVNSMAIDGTNKIYLSSSDKIFTSTNGGTTFTDITTTSGLAPTYTYFWGPMAVSTDGSVSLFNNGMNQIHKTTNQGASWTHSATMYTDFGAQITYPPVFISASTYLLPSSSDVLKTTNTGSSFIISSATITGGTVENIVVANTTGRIIATRYGRGYYSSTNGGTSWTFTPLATYVSRVIKLTDGTILLHGSGYFFRSTDNGNTFTQIDATYRNGNTTVSEAINGDLYSFYGLWNGSVYVPKVGRSTDKGLTWTELAVTGLPTYQWFSPIAAAIDNSNNIMFHGYDGTSNKTYKLVGLSVSTVTLPTTANMNNIFFLNAKFYASEFSNFYYSTDLGVTWTTVGFSGNKVFALKNSSYSGIAVSRNGALYISQNDGGSWANTTLPSSNASITSIATDAVGDFYGAASNGPVFKYTNELLVDPATLPPYINFNWQSLNGPYGGNIQRLQVSADGNTMYAISNNRLWKYSGSVWTRVDVTNINTAALITTIYDVKLDASGNVYILPFVGNPQKVYKSINGAANWTELSSSGLVANNAPNQNNLRRLEVTPNGSLLLMGLEGTTGVIYKSSDSGSTYTKRFTSSQNVFIGLGSSRIPAISPTNGTIAVFTTPAEGMLVSTDNGTTWTAKSTASIASTTNGFVGSYIYDKDGNLVIQSIVDNTIPLWDARISKSLDNGSTYTLLPTPTVPNAAGTNNYSKRIVTLGTGEYLMCIQTLFDCYRSTDGGATWTNIGNVGDVFINSVTNGTTSYIIGSSNAGILKTTDGGATFTPFSNGILHPSPNSISVLNNKDLLVGATRPYYSGDFGANFTLAALQPASSFIQVKDSLVGYGSRLLLSSKDGGKSWKSFGADNTFFTFLTPDASGTGYYGATSNTIRYSTDLVNWTNVPLSGLPSNFFISNLAIDQNGIIYAVIDDGSSLKFYKIVFGSATDISTLVGTTNPGNIRFLNNKFYLYDTRGIIYKSNDGETWTQTSAPAGSSLVTAGNYLFVTTFNLVLWVSRDDGNSWQSVGDTPSIGQRFVNVAINEFDGYAYATVTNGVARKSGNMVMPDDKTKPVTTAFLPANNATGVSLKPSLSITFDEVTRTVASKLIRLFDSTQPAIPVMTFDAATAVQNGKTWTFAVPNTLAFNKIYFVVIDAGAFTDIFGNASNAISSSTAWRFTTKAGPTISALSPASASSNIAPNVTLSITFSEPVEGTSGKNLVVYKSSAPTVPVLTVAATSGARSGNVLSYSLPSALEYGTSHFVKFDASSFTTLDGGIFSLLNQNTDWTFTTVSAPDTQAPAIAFTPNALTMGSAKVFSPTITDNIGVTQAKIFYRSISSNGNESSANLIFNPSTSRYDVTIAEADFGKMGLEFYFTATDAANNAGRSPQLGYHYSYINFPSNANPSIPGSLIGVGGTVQDWKMISIPYALTDNKVATVFSELGAIDKKIWRLITYKTNSWDEYPGDFTSITQGTGYFINMKALPPNGLTVEGASTPPFNKLNPFSLTLSPGWNQIGNPYPFKIVWSEVLAANNNPSGIGATIKKYSGNYVDGTDLDVFEGGFVLNSSTSTVTLNVPVTGSQSGGRISTPSYNLAEPSWTTLIKLKVGEVENVFGGIGMSPTAKLDVDDLDDFNPPHLSKYAFISFLHDNHFLKKTTKDIVPSDEAHTWDFDLETNINETAVLSWDNTRFGSNVKELYLFDINQQVVIDMRASNHYSFDPKYSKKFSVFYGEDLKDKVKPQTVFLGKPFPNPASGLTTIGYTLPESQSQSSYSVRLELFNSIGQRTSVLVDSEMQPGFYTTVCDMENDKNGLYFYRLTVTERGKQEVLIEKIVVNR
jgi:hypothetical protein